MKNAPPLVFSAVMVAALFTCASRSACAQALSVDEKQKARLANLVQKDDEAKAQFAPILKMADSALKDEPDPIAKIVSEGTLASDPRKIRTGQSLRDMGKTGALAWAWAVTGKKDYADKARAFLLAWAKTNVSAGNPINDTKLEPLFVAYDLVGAGFTPSDKKIVDDYFRAIALAEQESIKKGKGTSTNNWNSHRIKTVGLVGFALHDAPLVAWTTEAYQKQVAVNLRPDGSSMDFEDRDALHYHIYDLEPLLTVALAARQNDKKADWFHYQSPKDTSVAKSVAWLVPYATGEKQHKEYVNSKVAFDRKRAEAGEKGYAPGTIADPRSTRSVMQDASVWEPDKYRALALKLLAPEGQMPPKRFGSWQMVIDEARR